MVKQFNNFFPVIIFFSFSFSQVTDTLKENSIDLKTKESKVVTISAKLSLGKFKPNAYRLSLFPRNRPSEIYISRMFFPEDSIQVILPENILNSDTLGNIASLEPIGGSYETIYRLFSKSSGEIDLGNFEILPKTDIIKLNIIDGSDHSPVAEALINTFQSGLLISTTMADNMGYTRLRIPVDRDKENSISILIETGGRYPPWQGLIDVPEGQSDRTIQLFRLDVIPGASLYSVIKDLTPFRKGPENGSEILFFLSRGDQLVITKVAGNRLFGSVRIDLHDKQSSNFFAGWVMNQDVKLLSEPLINHTEKKNE